MQIFQDIAELPRPAKHAPLGEWRPVTLKQFLQRVAVNVLHYHEVALILGKEAVKGGQIGMIQPPEDLRLDLEILNSLLPLLGWHHREAHFFDSTYRLTFEILRLIDGSHSSLTDGALNQITLM